MDLGSGSCYGSASNRAHPCPSTGQVHAIVHAGCALGYQIAKTSINHLAEMALAGASSSPELSVSMLMSLLP